MFAMINLMLLWLLQVVFLQNFYDRMQLANVKTAADEIASYIGNDSAFSLIDRIAYENSMQVILTDTDGGIVYRVDEYSPAYQTAHNPYKEDSRQDRKSVV